MNLKKEKMVILILVTAMTPTTAGEGKTTTSVGLTDGLNHIGKNAMVALERTKLGSLLWNEGWSCWRRLCSGCPHGRYKSSFYWRFSCYNFSSHAFVSYD